MAISDFETKKVKLEASLLQGQDTVNSRYVVAARAVMRNKLVNN